MGKNDFNEFILIQMRSLAELDKMLGIISEVCETMDDEFEKFLYINGRFKARKEWLKTHDMNMCKEEKWFWNQIFDSIGD